MVVYFKREEEGGERWEKVGDNKNLVLASVKRERRGGERCKKK